MGEYPTDKQRSYIKDLYSSTLFLICRIQNLECDEIVIEPKEQFDEITTSSEVDDLIRSLSVFNFLLNSYRQSIEQKTMKDFKHLITVKDYFSKKDEFKNLYDFIEIYFVLPDFSKLEDVIVNNIKNEEIIFDVEIGDEDDL